MDGMDLSRDALVLHACVVAGASAVAGVMMINDHALDGRFAFGAAINLHGYLCAGV